MNRSRRQPLIRTTQSWLGLMLCVILSATAYGQTAQTAPAASNSPSIQIEQLRQLSDLAPARAMGQPGAQALDKWVQEMFVDAVNSQNDPAVQEQAQKTLLQVVATQARLNQIRNDLATPSQAIQDAISPVYLSLTVERPMPATIVCIMVAVMAFIAFLVQKRRSVLVLALIAGALAVGLPLAAWMVDTDFEKTIRQTRGVTDAGSQADVVTRELFDLNIQAANQLQDQWQTGVIRFPTAVFTPGTSHLQGPAGDVRLYQMAPNLVDPSNLPDLRLVAPLRYVGRATTQEVNKTDVRGAVVVMEFDTYKRWIDIVQLGAKAIIFVEPADGQAISKEQAASKTTIAPLTLPRFLITRKALAAAIGDNWQTDLLNGVEVKLRQDAPGKWASMDASTEWLFIPATTPSKGTAGNDVSRQLVHIQAFKDAASIVPELSPGASSVPNLLVIKQLLEQFRAQPPARPVLLSIVSAHTQALQGEAEFGHFAFGNTQSILDELLHNQSELAQQIYLSELHDLTDGRIDSDKIEYMRYAAPVVAGQVLKANKTVLDVLRAKRNQIRDLRIQAVLDHDRGIGRTGEKWTSEQTKVYDHKLSGYEVRTASIVKFMELFNRFGKMSEFKDLSPQERIEIEDIFKNISRDAAVRAAQVREAVNRNLSNLAVRRRLLALTRDDLGSFDASTSSFEELFKRVHEPLNATLVLNLDLSFDSDSVGLFAVDNILKDKLEADSLQRVSRTARYALELADQYATQTGEPNLLLDTIRNVGGVPWSAYLGSTYMFSSRMYHAMNLPALTLATTNDIRQRAFTPSDTTDRINAKNLESVTRFALGYIPRLVNGSELNRSRRMVGKADTLTVAMSMRQQDEFSVSVPQTPVTNALVVVWPPYTKGVGGAMVYGDIRSYPIYMTDERGVSIMRSGNWRASYVSLYKYDPQYSHITASLDMGDGGKRFSAFIKPGAAEHFITRTFVAFDSRKTDLIGLTEPLLLAPVLRLEVLDAAQDATPSNFGTSGILSNGNVASVPMGDDGVASVFIEPTAAFKLRAGQGLVINTTPDAMTGVGFDADTGLIRDAVLTSARDMWRLTDNRLEMLQSKGVSNDTATAFNTNAKNKLDESDTLLSEGKNERHLVEAEKARGMGYRAYTLALTTINDLIKAVVIFLAMVIPFCFFITKLISPFTDINRQISLFAAVFVGMAVLLWLVHPAFKIASTPAVVILAFIILGLAVFVAAILMGRFNASMNQAVEEALGSESADAPQGRLMGVAFMVGINNMKRRRIRTTLTCVTIVLVTFTMLSVISVGQDVEPARVRIGPETPYSGMLFTRPGLGPISDTQLRRIKAHFEENALIVSRVWVQRKGAYGDYLPYNVRPIKRMTNAAVDAAEAKVIVGMEVAEDGFTGSMPIAAGGRWFSRNDAHEVILSVQAAALLGITPENLAGQVVDINGLRLTLVGLLIDDRFAQMQDLGDLPLTPLLSQAQQETATAVDSDQASGQESLDSSGDLMSAPGIEPARPMDVAIVPLDIARTMPGADFYTLSIKYQNKPGDTNLAAASEQTLESARHFIGYQHARLYTGIEQPVTLASTGRTLEAGQYSLTSSSSTQVGGILKVAIPIILAATIILNTMLGSVMERRREVAIYNAIGLNPGHVMAFFLAESLVFGMIGAVAGYLIGQILSMAITYFNIVSLNLNYSSLSVMVVIFLTIATVMLSTIYPAMMAARAAVPSGQRRWALPQPEGNQIYIQFPFSYDATRVKGVCAYLHEFMNQNSEASTGKFLAKLGPVGTVPGDPKAAANDHVVAEATNYAMIFEIAAAPFDLGVNQTMEVYAYYDPHVKAHMLAVYLTRLSGEMSNWKTVNQPFLETLRKRLLGWRSQKPETHQAYYRKGELLFANATPLPVMAAASAASSQGER